MKQQLLSDGDRAVLTAAGSTAYFSVSLLHQNEAITSHELTQTATPLVVAAFLLVFVSVFARLPGSLTRIITLLPLAIAGIVIAALLASSTWSAAPENASLVALVGVAAWLVDRLDIGREGRAEQRRFARLHEAGYVPAEKTPLFALPQSSGSGADELTCWEKKDNSYLDLPGWLRLREEAGSRWRALSVGRGASAVWRADPRPGQGRPPCPGISLPAHRPCLAARTEPRQRATRA